MRGVVAAIAHVVADAVEGADALSEIEVARLVRSVGLPEPRRQVEVLTPDGLRRDADYFERVFVDTGPVTVDVGRREVLIDDSPDYTWSLSTREIHIDVKSLDVPAISVVAARNALRSNVPPDRP